jgi:DNA-binding MltR family transcriptional regulator
MADAERARRQRQPKSPSARRSLRKRPSAIDLYRAEFSLGGDKFDQGRPDPESADRAEALIGASFIEKALEEAIKTKLQPKIDDPDFDYLFNENKNGPVSTLSAKIRIAYALKIIDEPAMHDLDTIRELRNHFAHSLGDVAFSTPAVVALCDSLCTGDRRSLLEMSVDVDQRREAPRARNLYVQCILLYSLMLSKEGDWIHRVSLREPLP